ncbi:HAD-IA family hydrolase [Leptobacterium flavescens]|uniref:HAD-IA family hydrolase n=1 Tax=Leptobacterium flavescens TaxID=472055 RepID=A0A6P0UQ88_9FLAO|nr:HAD family hydrolase [Leptobacterium flavescens]NER13989.1 HAD-IA family hydrolase [Leptobacterium flavescens]
MTIKVDKNTVIVFDLDDTLYNELDYLRSAYRLIAGKVDPEKPAELFLRMFAMYRNKENVFEFLEKEYGADIGELLHIYRTHSPDIELKPGVLNIIESIRQKGGKTAIITDGRSITQRNKVKALGLEALMDEFIISEETGTEKPHPQNFELVQNKLEGTVYYYIGDNLKKDFISPNSLGWKTIALIDRGLNIHSGNHLYLKEENKPQAYIFGFKELEIQ